VLHAAYQCFHWLLGPIAVTKLVPSLSSPAGGQHNRHRHMDKVCQAQAQPDLRSEGLCKKQST
jgi:hypothetical protein